MQLTLFDVPMAPPPCRILWENVPGVLSTKDNAFGCFLGALAGSGAAILHGDGSWPDAGVVAGPTRRIAWRKLDAQYFGLAQRRERVFVVAGAGELSPEAVLFEPASMRRNPPTRRGTGKDAAVGTLRSTDGGCDVDHAAAGHVIAIQAGAVRENPTSGPDGIGVRIDGLAYTLEARSEVQLVFGGNNTGGAIDVAPALNAKGGSGRMDFESEALCVSLRGRDGSGTAELGGPLSNALRASSGGGDKPHVLCVHGTQDPCVSEIGHTLARNSGQENALPSAGAVRRMMPIECEKLQGLRPNHTLVPHRGKPMADGPRYRIIGNGWALNVVQWIAGRMVAEMRK